ncbi:hypothetical protein GP486_001531 [Trichoglossum hirsutum]|uniref:NACHT domain-containing protein n=1 Tax=Trichoglossum hirsutum TaxID=265104 RepID=A0A9P8LGZ6_9PEZI|nr:hypothetical protein GP486_001531 [Trichoglossum hirsutum]
MTAAILKRADTATSARLDLRPHPSKPILEVDYGPILCSWSKAVDLFNSRLTKDDKKKINLKDCQRASFVELLDAATTARDRVEKGRYPWTGTVQNIFRQINHYAAVGDLIVQHHAEYTSLVWGAFRFLLMFTVEEGKTSERLAEALETAVQVVLRAEEYAKLFSTHSSSSTEQIFHNLQENLTHLYAEVLNFLIRATRFFEKSALRRYVSAGLSPFDTKLGSILDRVNMLERCVEKDVNLLSLEGTPHNLQYGVPLLTREAMKLEREYENGVWLKHADFKTDLRKLQESHIPGTCEWFLQSGTYAGWVKPSADPTAFDLLWIHGKPGSGKSTLASQIICDLRSRRDLVVTYVFCKDGEENKNDLQSVLRNLVFQLLESFSSDKRFHTLVQNARLGEKSQFVQSIEIIWSMLKWMLQESSHVYCILDGLDECNNSVSERASFLAQLTEVFKAEGHTAKLVVISRLDLSEAADKSPLWKGVQVQSSDLQEDIKRIASTRLQNTRTLRTHPKKDFLLSSLVDSSDGMILWTELMIKELEVGHWNVQRVLLKPPRGLSEVYASILHRISEAVPTERVQRALQLILAAARPLSLEELALGLAVAEGLCSHEEYDLRGDPTAEGREIVLALNPLLMIMPDETVQLAHTSLKDYLLGSQAPPTLSVFQFRIGSVHHEMALVLISYLSFQCFKTELDEQTQGKHRLLEYASAWLVHHSTKSEDSRRTAEMLIAFFQIEQGWRWLERLQATYEFPYGHLLLMQSELKHWVQSVEIDSEDRITLGSFLLVLARRRYEDMKKFPIHHPSVLRAMASLGSTYRKHGHFGEAEDLEIQVLDTRKRVLGTEHLDTLQSMSNLSMTYSDQGRWKEAEELQVQVLEARKKMLGAEHPVTLQSMGNIAATYSYQGRWKEAEELEVQVLETRKDMFGEEHPFTLQGMGNLATTYLYQGRWEEAEKLEIQVLEARKKVFGAEDPDVLSAMSNIAATYLYQERWEEAEKLEVQALKARKKVLGEEHPDTLLSMSNLAMAYTSQGRWKEAEELGVQLLEMRKSRLGVEHPDTLESIHNLATTYFEQGKFKEAEKLTVHVLEKRKRVLGEDHPDTLTSMFNLSWTWRSLNKDEDSVNLMEQAVKISREKLGPDHPDTKLYTQTLHQWKSG